MVGISSLHSILLRYLGFSWLLKTIPIRPLAADIRVTQNCNSKCIACTWWKKKPFDELNTGEIIDVLNQLKQLGIEDVRFTGGEPLLRRDIGLLVNEAKSIGFKSISVATNGILLEKKAKELVDGGVTNLTVSIDGTEQTDSLIRGVRIHYRRAKRGIQTLHELVQDRNCKVIVTVLSTLTTMNIEEVPYLIQMCRDLGVNWYFNLLDFNSDFCKDANTKPLVASDNKKIDHAFDYIEKARLEFPGTVWACHPVIEYARRYMKREIKGDIPCILGYKRIYVGAHGEVYSSCLAMDPVGNLRKSDLREIVSSPEYRERLEKMYKRECPGCTHLFGDNVMFHHLLRHEFFCKRNL